MSAYLGWIARVSLLVALIVGSGCGKSGRAMIPIHGTVTFEGKPVTTGTVQFNDPTTGDAPSADLGPDGRYTMTVPEGDYTVSIFPKLVNTGSEDMPNWVYKNAADIPAKYRDPSKSGFVATVGRETEFHFALKK
jgi:hypothetical protein